MKKPNVTLIGIFVLGAIILIFTGIIVLGAGRVFSKHPTFIMYFSGSVKGLTNGSDVVFKGVKIGKVINIGIRYNPETRSAKIAVLAQIYLNRITRTRSGIATQDFFLKLISEGLKAQLQYQNFMTGQLLVELDFHPEKPAVFVRSGLPYPEIPTIPSSLEAISKTVASLPLDELVRKMADAVENLSRVAGSREARETIRSMNLAIEDIRNLTRNIDGSIQPLTRDIHGTLADSRLLLKDFRKQSSSIQASVQKVADATEGALIQTRETLKAFEHAGAAGSPVMYQLNQTLEKISDASDSLRALSDYLNRHPEALLWGKKGTGTR